jgi:hypothetical protein
MQTLEEVILDDIWTVFNEANKDREPMLSGDDEDKITELLEKYHQAKLKLLGIPDVVQQSGLPCGLVGCDKRAVNGTSACEDHQRFCE